MGILRERIEHLEPARTVIERVGGVDRVSEITGKHVSRVYRWMYEKSRGGTGGTIPQTFHVQLLDHAKQEGIPLRAEDFLAAKVDAAA